MTTCFHRSTRLFWSMIVLFLLMGTAAVPAQAQLSKIKKKAKQVVDKPKKDTPPAEAKPDTLSAKQPAPATEAAMPEESAAAEPQEDDPLVSGATLIPNPDLPSPALAYFSILEGLQHSTFWRDGKFGFFGTLHGVFLPAVEGDKRYSPYGKGDAILAHQIKKGDGTLLQTNVYDGWPKDEPFYDLSGLEFIDGFEQGDYVVEWFLEGELFQRLPFHVDVLTSGDDYKPAPHYYLEGPWNGTMAVYQPNGGPSPVKFGFWYRDKSYERDKFTKYWWRIDVKRDGRMVAQLPVQKERNERKQKIVTGGEDIRPWWEFREFLPHKAGTTNDVFTRDDLKDGTYEVTFALVKDEDGSVVEERTHRFSVTGGKIQPAGRQVRGETDAPDVIEGGQPDGNGHYFFFEQVQ